MASQVLPSPPHTRQRSSLASEFRMLSQPTCFDINKTMSEVSRLKLEAVCSFVSAVCFFSEGECFDFGGVWHVGQSIVSVATRE